MKPKRPKRYHPDKLDDSAITTEIVKAWWKPRFGTSNPERMNNPLWEWLVRTRMEAYAAAKRFGYPETSRHTPDFLGPAWCFARFGQSVTHLPDGRIVLIAGEHEDHYDPDFNIYNDVTVYHPDDSLEIFGYPIDVFPPTDFHTATLVGNRIIIMGNLGYPEDRKIGTTHVMELDITTWSIKSITTTGEGPGWIHKQVAEPDDGGKCIKVRGGLICHLDKDGQTNILENPDDWCLDLNSLKWSRVHHERWTRYGFGAAGLRHMPLWKINCLPFTINFYGDSNPAPGEPTPKELVPTERWEDFQTRFGGTNAKAQADAAKLYQEGFHPDLEVFESLYRPDIPHQPAPSIEPEDEEEEAEDYDPDGPFDFDEDDYSTPGDVFDGTRILVDGVIVRYKDEGYQVILTIEGDLPEATTAALTSDLQRKLEILLMRPVYCQKL
jgi:hypothetical protein